jgi:pimeloyl-ACP methyl ester carboxylesterase
LRGRRLKFAYGCLVALILSHAAGAAECANFFGQRCRTTLATGVHMSYFEAGQSDGETLIFLHTDTTSAVEWAWTVAALLELDPALHVFALDQRGAGDTDLPATRACWYTPNRCIRPDDLAADVLAFMSARQLGKVTLVGHAMGAAAARRVALAHPERITRLILSGTGLPRRADPTRAARPPLEAMKPLGWQPMLEARGVQWPQGALHMRPLDIDADAVNTLLAHWDISAVADPERVRIIAAQTASESLSTWGTMDLTQVPATPEKLEALAVPTLVLWGSEDAGLDRASQMRLVEVLRVAARAQPRMYFYWKRYGVRPPPVSGDKHDADDIGHNLSWEAPRQLAADIDQFIRTGAPTSDLYRSDAPLNPHAIVVEPGRAELLTSRRH